MGGAGGVSGAVSFPLYISDFHGLIMANTQIFDDGSIKNVSFVAPSQTIIGLTNDLWATSSPYDSFTYTNPTTELAANKAQFDLFYSAATEIDTNNFSDYITKGLLAVTNPTVGQIPDISQALNLSAPTGAETLFISFATTLRAELTKNLDQASTNAGGHIPTLLAAASTGSIGSVSLTAITTMWSSMISSVTTMLKECDIPAEVSVLSVINEAASNAGDNLKAALRLANNLVSGTITAEMVTAFAARRETTYQQQISQYAGTMADMNAVNSSAFMFGVALLRSEQQREVSDFDAQISLDVLRQGLSSYVQMHAEQLRVSSSVKLANAAAHNAFLQTSIQLLTTLNLRGEVLPRDLLSMYSQLFAAEMQTYSFMAQAAVEGQSNLYGENTRKQQIAHTLQLQADLANKDAKERRYQMGMGQIYQVLTNRVEFERAAASLLTEQNRIKIVARSEYETGQLEVDVREILWDVDVGRTALEMLASPAGMAAALPKTPPMLQSAIGGALQGAAAGAVASGGNPIAAGAGAVLGGLKGILG